MINNSEWLLSDTYGINWITQERKEAKAQRSLLCNDLINLSIATVAL